MRKITRMKRFNESYTDIPVELYIKNEDGSKQKIDYDSEHVNHKYTLEQFNTINEVNAVLIKHNLPKLTEEEADFMLQIAPTPRDEEIQRLAGFKVKKEITYFDDLASKAEV